MTCEDGVCDAYRTFGPPTGDVSGLGYCDVCVPGSQARGSAADDDLVDELLFEDGAGL